MALGRKYNADGEFNPFDDSELSSTDSFMGSLSNIFRRKKTRKRGKTSKHSRKRSRKRKRHSSKSVSRKRKRHSSGIKFTKRGQPYILDKKTGKAKFIKRR